MTSLWFPLPSKWSSSVNLRCTGSVTGKAQAFFFSKIVCNFMASARLLLGLVLVTKGPTWSICGLYKQKLCKVVTKESVQRVLSLKIRDVSVSWLAGLMLFSIFIITSACLSFWDVCCRSKMCIVSSTREAKFVLSLKKKWRWRLGKKSRLTSTSANG